LSELRSAEQALALGGFREAQAQVQAVLDRDPLNYRALQLFAEIQRALQDPAPVEALVKRHIDLIYGLPSIVLVQLAEVLTASDMTTDSQRSLSQQLLASAARGHLEERELRRIAVAMLRACDPKAAMTLLDRQLRDHPEWERNASLRHLRGDALLGLAKLCRSTAKTRELSLTTRQRAWHEFHAYLERAEKELREALEASVDPGLTELIHRNLEFLERFRKENEPPATVNKRRNGLGRNDRSRR